MVLKRARRAPWGSRLFAACLTGSAALAIGAAGLTPALGQPAGPAAPAANTGTAASTAPPAVPSAAPTAAPSAAPTAAPSAAQSPATPATDEAAAQAKKRAFELRDSANKHYQKAEYTICLSELQASYRLFPTPGALTGAGTCLVKLQRYDEALDAFEAAIAQFGPTLSARTKTAASQQIDAMRTVTGGLAVSGAEVGAMIVLDGRVRGEHPTRGPVNALAGPHLIRVYKEGFAVFEKSVDVVKSEVTNVPVKLAPLVQGQTGRLKVEETGGKKMQVVVDGIPVGVTPWEGPVTPGEHTVVLRPLPPATPAPPRDDSGCAAPLPIAEIAAVAGPGEAVASAPVRVVVKPNETAPVKAKVEPLTAALRILPDPATARVFLDGIAIGRGGFEGRIRPGDHTIKVEEEGYLPEETKTTVTAGGQQIITVKLRKDIQSAVWVEAGHYTMEIGAGPIFAPTLGGDVATGCNGKCRQGVGSGARVALRGGYQLGNGFSFGITAGYLDVQQTTTGRVTALHPYAEGGQGAAQPSAGAVNDTLSIRDLTAGVYAAYRLGRRFPLTLGLSAGVALGAVTDTRTGIFGNYGVGPVSQSGFIPWIFFEPEARAGVRVTERFGLGLSLAALILITPRAPQWSEAMLINPHGDELGKDITGDAPVGQFKAESVTGSTIFALTPGLQVHYDF